jgi:hypothetical protein
MFRERIARYNHNIYTVFFLNVVKVQIRTIIRYTNCIHEGLKDV